MTLGLREVEKIERFYLSSCTDLSLASNLHYTFPTLDESVYSRTSRLSRPHSVSFSEVDETLNSNNRAKETFLRICDSLGSGVPDEALRKNDNAENKSMGSCHLIMNPSMSKEEFIKKLEEGMFRAKNSNESPELESENFKEFDYKHAKSDSVLVKAMQGAMNNNNPNDSSKSTTAIDSKNKSRNGSGEHASAASKAIFTGIILLIFFGFVKSVASKG